MDYKRFEEICQEEGFSSQRASLVWDDSKKAMDEYDTVNPGDNEEHFEKTLRATCQTMKMLGF